MAEKEQDILNKFKTNQEEEAAEDTTTKKRGGIIGTGWIAEAHIESYKRMPDV